MKNSPHKGQAKVNKNQQAFIFGALIILLTAAVLRLILLTDLPPGLSQDEVLNADVVKFIREGYHAFFFREGYGHEPLYHYWSVPFQVLFGDNTLSIRLPAVYLGILLVAASMRWVKREYGLLSALFAGAGLAVSWWPIIFSRIGIRPIMEPVFLVIFAWMWPRKPWLAGLFLGLSVYTYTGARVVFLLPIALFFYWFFAKGWVKVSFQKFLGQFLPLPQISAVIVFITSLLIVIPLFYTLWVDPTLQQRVDQLAGPLQELQNGHFQPIASSFISTLGVFSFQGDPRWTYSLPGRPLFNPLMAALFYVGLLITMMRFRQPAYAFALFWLGIGLIPSAITPQAPSTVRLVGAMPVVYLMPAVGLTWLFTEAPQLLNIRSSNTWVVLISVFTGLVLLFNVFLTIRDGFIRWPNALETREKYQSIILDIARDIEANPPSAAVIADGFYRPITADTLKRELAIDLPIRWVQTGSDLAGAVVIPVERGARFYIPEYTPPNADLMKFIGLDGEPDYRSSGNPSFAVFNLPQSLKIPTNEEITFGGKITLVGYDTSVEQSGQSIQLFLVWRVDNLLPADLASFAHLINNEGELLSQFDGFDAAPETLAQGDLVIQRYVLPLTGFDPNEESSFHIGFYNRRDGSRLLRSDGLVEPRDQVIISRDGAILE